MQNRFSCLNFLFLLFFLLMIQSVPLAFAQKFTGFYPDYDAALKASWEKRQNMMIDFYTATCFPSKQLDQEVYRNKAFLPYTDSIICVKVDGESPEGRPLVARFGITGYPTVLFVDPDGQELERLTAFIPLDPFLENLKRILSGNTIPKMESRFLYRRNYHDLYILTLYYVRNVFNKDKLDRYFKAFRKLDPSYSKDSTRVLTRYVLQKELRMGISSVTGEMASYVFQVPEGNSYKLAIQLTDYYLQTGDPEEAWSFFSDYYLIREDKSAIYGYFEDLKRKTGHK
ncbi:MAG: thioredoxin family protein [Chlorobi bacterium]|nr:thioredoxin family protein [Chlorobiota bacterium]